MPKLDFKKKPRTSFKSVGKLSFDQARQEAEALREGIDYHDYLYYVKNSPEISDATYDKLFRRLEELEGAFPELRSPNSPTRRVGAPPVSKLTKKKHTAPMLSLRAAGEENEVEEFWGFLRKNSEDGVEVVLEPKFDGFSVEVVYEDGEFRYGTTRGDGTTGEDISENLKTIGALPLRLRSRKDAPERFAVRAEVFMRRSGFKDLNKDRLEKGLEPFANPRNAAAGMMRQLDSRNVAGMPLDVFFYEVLSEEGLDAGTHWEVLERLEGWGLKTSSSNVLTSNLKEVKDYHSDLLDQRDELDFEIDGVVVKLNDYSLREKLGTRQRSPRWALAWKFPPKKEVTRIEEIVVQVGRTGMLTPVALLQPVDVGGVTVSRATLHNEDEVRKKDVRPGDRVRVQRAGDVIPEVVERIEEKGGKRGKRFSMPGKCPSCGSRVYREGAYYLCSRGLRCPAQLAGHIIHYGSREAMDVEGLGEKTVRQMVELGMVESIAGLYRLDVDDILGIEGFAKKSARQLHDAIQSSKKARLDRFLYALGIRHVGEHVAMVLARRFQTLDKLRKASRKDLEATGEIGPEIALSVEKFFREKDNRKVLDELEEAGVEVEPMPGKTKTALEGKTFVFTGTLEGFTRSEAKKAVQALGARAASSVSGETDFLVVGANPGSKLDEAKDEGVKVIDEKEFRKIVE